MQGVVLGVFRGITNNQMRITKKQTLEGMFPTKVCFNNHNNKKLKQIQIFYGEISRKRK
jgi:hypothetical protein